VAASGKGNLLEAAVEAARARATVGEISDAMRSAFGDHTATPEVIKDVYGEAYRDEPELAVLKSRLSDLGATLGRRPKIMVAKLGQDGHDRGAKVIASAFGDIGFDVLAGPLFQTPQEAADLAVASKVNVVGISSLAAGHKTLAPQLIEALKARAPRTSSSSSGELSRARTINFSQTMASRRSSDPEQMSSRRQIRCWIYWRENGGTTDVQLLLPVAGTPSVDATRNRAHLPCLVRFKLG
jgi:methylmalonyl-CoA mutase cobalamin-binding subunit